MMVGPQDCKKWLRGQAQVTSHNVIREVKSFINYFPLSPEDNPYCKYGLDLVRLLNWRLARIDHPLQPPQPFTGFIQVFVPLGEAKPQ